MIDFELMLQRVSFGTMQIFLSMHLRLSWQLTKRLLRWIQMRMVNSLWMLLKTHVKYVFDARKQKKRAFGASQPDRKMPTVANTRERERMDGIAAVIVRVGP